MGGDKLSISFSLQKVLTRGNTRPLSRIPKNEVILFADDSNSPVEFHNVNGKIRRGYMHTVTVSHVPTRRFIRYAEYDIRKGKRRTKVNNAYISTKSLEEEITRNALSFKPLFIEGGERYKNGKINGKDVSKYYDIALAYALNMFINNYGEEISAIVLCTRFTYHRGDISTIRKHLDKGKVKVFDKYHVTAHKKRTADYKYKQYVGEIGKVALRNFTKYGRNYGIIEVIPFRNASFLKYHPEIHKHLEIDRIIDGKPAVLEEGKDYITTLTPLLYDSSR